MDKIEQFEKYCEQTGCPNSIHTFALWNALNEAQEKLKERGWMPIESAPKDGNCLLAIKTDSGFEFEVLGRDKRGNWIHEGEPTFCYGYYFEPKFWMPLLKAPNA